MQTVRLHHQACLLSRFCSCYWTFLPYSGPLSGQESPTAPLCSAIPPCSIAASFLCPIFLEPLVSVLFASFPKLPSSSLSTAVLSCDTVPPLLFRCSSPPQSLSPEYDQLHQSPGTQLGCQVFECGTSLDHKMKRKPSSFLLIFLQKM